VIFVCVTGPNGLLQHGESCFHLGLWVRRQIQIQSTGTRAWYRMRRVKRRVHFEIERSNVWGAPQFKWQSLPAASTLKDKPFAGWLTPRNITLRPLYWEISSDGYSNFKTSYEVEDKKECFGVLACENLVPSLKRTREGVETTGRPGLADIPNTVSMWAVCILWENIWWEVYH